MLFLCEELLALLARHVGDAHLKHTEPLPCTVDHLVVLLLSIVGRVFEGELADGNTLFLLVLDDADAAEDNNAAVCSRGIIGDELKKIDNGES